MRFFGQYNHTLDEKNRVTVPAKYRTSLGDSFMATIGLDHCVAIYPHDAYDEYTQKMMARDQNKANVRRMQRYVSGNSFDLSLDRQGRIVLPESLITLAGIKKNVVVAGNMDHIEIWDAEKREEYLKSMPLEFEKLAEELDA